MIEQDLIHYYQKEGLSYNISKGGEGCSIKRFSDEELKEHRRQYYLRYRNSHREELLEKHRIYNETHREEIRVRDRIFYDSHREERNATRRERYHSLTPEQKKARAEKAKENKRRRKLLKQNNI